MYVAVYGHDFRTAGREVFNLFEGLGWTAIVNDDLIEHVLGFGCFATAAIVGLIGYGYGEAADLDDDYSTILAVAGVFVGYSMCSLLLGLIDSAVATIFVCFAENPSAFEATNPLLHNGLQRAWMQMHGQEMAACGRA